jgi:hypothetical protein
MKKYFKSEEEFAEIIVNWLKNDNWTVYQEVERRRGGKVADIVAEKNGKYWIIECKLNCGFSVMCQADNWGGYANYVSIAVPLYTMNEFRKKICKLLNIGIIGVNKKCYLKNDYEVNRYLEIPERELTNKHLINKLTEKHKIFAKAGNNYGHKVTTFNLTVDKLIDYVKNNNGCLLKDAISNIKHHYSTKSSAFNSLSKLIDSDIIKNLYIDKTKEGTKIYLKDVIE